jgi:hypothetical protein
LGVYTYSFKNDPGQKKNIGVIAQEAEPLFPEMVYFNEGQYGVSYGQLAAIGIKAIQEQQELIKTLRDQIQLIKESMTTSTVQETKPDSTQN